MLRQSEDEVYASLSSEAADQRMMAAYVAGDRGLHWHKDLITLLTDPVDIVRQAARRSLIVESYMALNPDELSVVEAVGKKLPPPAEPLAQPFDFGPLPGASPSAQKRAVAQWTEWWAEKRPAAGRSMGQSRIPPEFNADYEHEHLAVPILKAGAARKAELIALYRTAEGSGYTEALAFAIDRTSADDRDALREALAARTSFVTEDTLRRRLDDRLTEVRRAAVVELARRENTVYVDQMMSLLLDPEPAVQRTARAALCQLSGQDFGPKHDATESERTRAVFQWRDWWKKNPR